MYNLIVNRFNFREIFAHVIYFSYMNHSKEGISIFIIMDCISKTLWLINSQKYLSVVLDAFHKLWTMCTVEIGDRRSDGFSHWCVGGPSVLPQILIDDWSIIWREQKFKSSSSAAHTQYIIIIYRATLP